MRYAYKVETMGPEDIPIHTLVKLPPRTPRTPVARPPVVTVPEVVGTRASRPSAAESYRRKSPRRPLSAKMSLWTREVSHVGWTLNVSDGGVRVLVEDAVVDAGAEMTVEVREDGCSWQRRARVVWVKRELGGCFAGLQFVKATSILGVGPANDDSSEDILTDSSPIYSSKFSFG